MHLAPNIFQVMLDTANHPELSDYIRVMVFNTTDPFASIPVDISKISTGRGSPRAGRRGQSQALLNPLSSNDAEGSRHIGPKPAREASIRFTGFLPEEHALTKIAKQLHQARLAAGAQGEAWALIITSRHVGPEPRLVGWRQTQQSQWPLTRRLRMCVVLSWQVPTVQTLNG